MNTDYQVIFDKFIKKLKGDNDFFNYKNMTETEIQQIVDDHLVSLLNASIDRLYTFGLPEINLYDKDDSLMTFNVELVPQEVSLLSEIMYLCHWDEERNKIKAFSMTFRNSELNIFSPANERKTTLDLIEKLELNIVNSISNYFSRDRLTWKEKSIYGGV